MTPNDHPDINDEGADSAGRISPPAPQDHHEHALLSFLIDIQNYKRHPDLWEAMACLIRRSLRTAGGGIMLLNRDKQEFFVPAASVEDAGVEIRFKSMRFPAGEAPFAQLFPTEAALVLNDFKHEPHVFRHMNTHVGEYISNRLDVPLRIKDTIVGTLWAINCEEGHFDASSAVLMSALAGITGSAMQSISCDAYLSLSDQRMKHFNLSKSHVVDHLSHAIKTPLAVSIASLKLLEKHLRKLPDSAWQKIYRRAERSLGRLLTIEYEMEDILRRNQPSKDEGTSLLSEDDLTTTRTDPSETTGALQRAPLLPAEDLERPENGNPPK